MDLTFPALKPSTINVLQDSPRPDDKVSKAVAELLRELMSTLRHPNIRDRIHVYTTAKLFAHAHVSHGSVRS